MNQLKVLYKHTVLVTGGASGLGKGLIQYFANQGYCIILLDFDIDKAVELTQIINDGGAECYFQYCDLSSPDSVKLAAEKIIELYDSIDLIIHNARGRIQADTKHMSDKLTLEFEIQIKHPTLINELLEDLLKKSENPSVIFIGSTNGRFVSHQSLEYHVCKGAIEQLVRFFAVKWADLGIRVNMIQPGIIDIPDRTRTNALLFKKVLDYVVPLRRTAKISEVGALCTFLASESARYINGASITLDGGEHLQDHFSLLYRALGEK